MRITRKHRRIRASLLRPHRHPASLIAGVLLLGTAFLPANALAGENTSAAADAAPADTARGDGEAITPARSRLGLPEDSAPCDDPRRITLGEEWDDYVERCATVLDSLRAMGADEQARAFALLNLLPEYVAADVATDNSWPEVLYDPRLLAPGRILRDRTSDPALQAMAAASMAAAARAFDWGLACDLATEAYALADSATEDGAKFASRAWSVIEFMESALDAELNAHRRHLARALELYKSRHGRLPADWVLRDTGAFWAELRPFMAEAVSAAAGSGCRNPDAADLTTNRLQKTPGIRIAWSVPSPESPPVPGFFAYHMRRGRAFTVWSSLVEEARPSDSPENVMLNYVFAHRTRDIDLYRSLLDARFQSFAVDAGQPPKDFDQEVASTGGLFQQAATIELYMEFERAVPSVQKGYSAAEGYWEVIARNCVLQARDEPAGEPTTAQVDAMIFVLRRESGAGPWKIVAQIVPS